MHIRALMNFVIYEFNLAIFILMDYPIHTDTLYNKRIIKALSRCAGWSVHLLFAYKWVKVHYFQNPELQKLKF